MYRIMLVDDEAGVRNSIKAKIDWESAGFSIDREASNGLEALRFLEDGPLPDVIITDIRMPKMDGVDLVRACKERYPRLRMVVLSGYSDFEYTRAAIQLGVRDYLLKPVARSELTSLLASLAGELKAERETLHRRKQEELRTNQMLQVMQEQLIWQLVKDEWFSLSAVKERLQQLQLPELAADDWCARFAVVEMRIPPGRLEDGGGRKDLLHLAFQMLCRESAGRRENCYPIFDLNHPAMMVFLVVENPSFAQDQGAEAFMKELQREIKRFLRVDSVPGIGEPARGLRQLKDGYASCMLSWSRNTVTDASQAPDGSLMELMHVFTPEAEKKFIQAIESMDKKALDKQLEALFFPEKDTPMFVFTFLTLRIILLFTSIAKKFELGDESLQKYLWNCQMSVRDYQSREQVLEQLREMAGLVMEEVHRTRFSSGQQIAVAVRKYVDENFSYELALSSLAELFHLNENYLSGLFKQHTGTPFSEYVTRLRLEKAASLLKENELKLTDIATLVGYSSSSYFSTAFKKHYGISPKEYRETAAKEPPS